MAQENSTIPELDALEMMEEDFPPNRIYVDIGKAEKSDIGGMLSIFKQAFECRDPRLAQLMYSEGPSVEPMHRVLKDILESHLDSQNCRFIVAYDNSDGEEYEYSETDTGVGEHAGTDTDDSDNSENLTLGWISVSLAPSAFRNVYAASELNTYACLRVLGQARIREEDHQNIIDCYSRLLPEIENRSIFGQARYINEPHLVVNALVCWPDLHEDTYWEMTFKLLAWVANFAERRRLPVWSQIPVDQKEAFRRAGFTEVATFTLNLNDYKPHRSTDNWGTQEWVQMKYFRAPGDRLTRSTPPRDRGERSRRPSF